MAQNNVLRLNDYRKGLVDILFNTNKLDNDNSLLVYKIGPNHSFIRIKNNRMYRVVCVHLIEILVTNIPSNWEYLATFRSLSDGNLKSLITSFTTNK